MTFTTALFSMLLIIFASLFALNRVEGGTDFSGLQEVKDARMMNEHQVKAQELHAKMFQAALQEYQLHTNTVADKKVKEGISKALREYHAKTAHLVAANQASKPEALRETTRLTERKSDVNCNTDTKSVQYNDKDYTTAPDETSFSFGSNDPNNNNGQSNNNNNNGGQSSSNDFGYNNPSTAAAQKSSCGAQRVPAYQQTMALFILAFVIIKWTEKDHK